MTHKMLRVAPDGYDNDFVDDVMFIVHKNIAVKSVIDGKSW